MFPLFYGCVELRPMCASNTQNYFCHRTDPISYIKS
jgi:hypothetical protein